MEGVRVEITEEAFGAITKHIAIRKRGETGGILIGQYSPDHLTAKVLSASGPGKLPDGRGSHLLPQCRLFH